MSNERPYYIMPEYSPVYPKLPYYYRQYRRISIYCKGNEDAIREFLPKPLEYVNNQFEVFVLNNTEVEGLDNYQEAGIVITAKYKDIVGAYMAYEYVNSDDALLAGREIWGYPKKMADCSVTETEEKIVGICSRKGKEIIHAEFVKDENAKFEIPQLFPRIQVKRIPRGDAPGCDVDKVFMMFGDTGNEFGAMHEIVMGKGTVTFEKSEFDPLYKLGPAEIIGARFATGDFVLDYGKDITDYEPNK